jgi:hypothetical protein
MNQSLTTRTTPLLALALAAAACAQAPPVEGAACPCPLGYYCSAEGVCVRDRPTALDPPRMVPVYPMGPPSAAAVCPDPGPARPLRLGGDEYGNTIRDLTGVELPAAQIPPPLPAPGEADPLDPEGLGRAVPEPYLTLADHVARATSIDLSRYCDNPTAEDGCAMTFVESFGRRAFRRPLTRDEISAMMAAYKEARKDQALVPSLRAVVAALLRAPAFVYRLESGSDLFTMDGKVLRLTPWEIAVRLSYFFTRSMPDENLFNAAEWGQLRLPDGIVGQATRLMADPRSLRTLAAFHRQWLEIGDGDRIATDGPVNAALRQAMLDSVDALVRHVVFEKQFSLQVLMTWPSVWADPAMAAFYDLAPSADGTSWLMPRSGQQRAGLLTTPALLASFARGPDSAPVQRGRMILERLLCTELPPPPAGANATLPPPGNLTTRERLRMHMDNPSCRPCHETMDTLGFGLDNYDGYGRWRTSEQGRPLDVAGEVEKARFDGPEQLADRLSRSDAVSACVTRHWFRAAFHRYEIDKVDDCTIRALHEEFKNQHGWQIHRLLLSIAGSSAFQTLRAPAPAAPPP